MPRVSSSSRRLESACSRVDPLHPGFWTPLGSFIYPGSKKARWVVHEHVSAMYVLGLVSARTDDADPGWSHHRTRYPQTQPHARSDTKGVTRHQMQRPRPERHAESSPLDTKLTAVCLAGELRSFLFDEVQASFAVYVHSPGYEYFISTDEPRPVTQKGGAALRLAPIRAWVSARHGHFAYIPCTGVGECSPMRYEHHLHLPPCPNTTCNPHRFLLPMASRLKACHERMEQQERASSRPLLIRAAFAARPRLPAPTAAADHL